MTTNITLELGRTVIRYVSISLKTTGEDCLRHQIIEFGAVIDDLNNPKPLNQLPKFHRYIFHDNYVGEPQALAACAEIFHRISIRDKRYNYSSPFHARREFSEFLVNQNLVEKFQRPLITVAAPYFFKYGNRFLEKDEWNSSGGVDFCKGYLDPINIYFNPRIDERMPSLEVCFQRAGIERELGGTSVEDAVDIIKLIRANYGLDY